MSPKKLSLTPGFVLILIGLWLMADHVSWIENMWMAYFPFLILFFSAVLFCDAIRRKSRNPVFWAVIYLIIGTFFAFRSYDILFKAGQPFWPVFPISLGIAFVVLFLIKPQDWGVLIPACIFLFFGVSASSDLMFDVTIDWLHVLEVYWPVLVIVVGVGVVFSGFAAKKPQKD